MKSEEITKIEKKKEEELAELSERLRGLYRCYYDSITRISFDIRSKWIINNRS